MTSQPFAPQKLRRDGVHLQVRLISYCPKHCTARPELAGVQLVKDGEEEDRGDDGNGLWNCQPFKQPPSVPVPDCTAGSSRAQPLQVSPAQ